MLEKGQIYSPGHFGHLIICKEVKFNGGIFQLYDPHTNEFFSSPNDLYFSEEDLVERNYHFLNYIRGFEQLSLF
jgi:hypothetical protein